MASTYDSVWVPQATENFFVTYEGVLESTWGQTLCKRVDSAGNEFLKPIDVDSVGQVQPFTNNNRGSQKPVVYTLIQQNIPYQLSLKVDIEDVKRDRYGIFESRVSEMAEKFADHPNFLITGLLKSNPTCFDGTAFFGSTHPVNGTTQTNDLTSTQVGSLLSSNYTGATSTSPTAVMMADVIQGIWAQFYTLIDNAGDPLNGGMREITFVTGNPSIHAKTVTAIDSLQLSQGATNPLISLQDGGAAARYTNNPKSMRFLAILDPRVSAANSSTAYAFRSDSVVKPFIWGEESGVEIDYIGAGSQLAFDRNQYAYGAKAVRSIGVGHYQHGFRYTLS